MALRAAHVGLLFFAVCAFVVFAFDTSSVSAPRGSGSGSAAVYIDAATSVHAASPLLWGIFFEEINHAGQGGLYSQLVCNTNFEFVDYWPWSPVGNSSVAWLSLSRTEPLNANNRQHMQVSFTAFSSGISSATVGISNPGFYGMTFLGGSNYLLSLYAFVESQIFPAAAELTIVIEDSTGLPYAKFTWTGIGHHSWTHVQHTLTPSESITNGRLSIYFSAQLVDPSISIHFDMVSLFPEEGWNGLNFIRPDIAEMIADLHPAFVRFPGGGYIEGDTLDHRFQWKDTIGPLESRPGHYDIWNYWSEDGLGFYEYLLFIEKLTSAQGTAVEPIWVVNNGVAYAHSIPPQDIKPWILDALQSLEFAMGDANSSAYGAVRASLGHPQPFTINFVGIGNEGCGKLYYTENYNAFYAAIKDKYPNVTLIANCDLTVDNATVTVDLWDFHVYQNASWFIANIHQWDGYPRSGSSGSAPVFASEYAVNAGCGLGNVNAAIAEAAYMTGLERNSDIITMASYAPLLVNSNDRRWNPDAIVFDSSRVYGTPSYWVQHMFSNAQSGTDYASQRVLEAKVSGFAFLALSATLTQSGAQLEHSKDSHRQQSEAEADDIVIIKAVNYDMSSAVNVTFSVKLSSAQEMIQNESILCKALSSAHTTDENTFDTPKLVQPVSCRVSNSQHNTSGSGSGSGSGSESGNGTGTGTGRSGNSPKLSEFTVEMPAYSALILRMRVLRLCSPESTDSDAERRLELMNE